MCGISGIVNFGGVDPTSVLPLHQALSHRGPDADGLWSKDPEVVLAHRRLSILDVSAQSHQPMEDDSGRFVICFNGEIYNFKDLRADLARQGASFRTTGDTEIILKLWQQKGIKAVDDLEGMFAFAMWDRRDKTLHLVRDRFGEKPLFYTQNSLGLLFASELKALMAHPSIQKSFNRDALIDYLTLGYVTTHNCIIDGIHKLPPGHHLTLSPQKGAVVQQYYDLAAVFKAPKHTGSDDDLIQEYLARFDRAVAQTSISDVPLGLFLSGGLDSSSIAASMVAQGQNPQALTIAFEQESFNELPKAQEVAKHLGVSLTHHTLTMNDMTNHLETIVSACDEPFSDTSMVAMYHVCKMAKQQFTVCLSGDAGDELFAGYETYKADQVKRFIPLPLSFLNPLIPTTLGKVSLDYKLKKFFKGTHYHPSQAHFFWRTIFDHPSYIDSSFKGLRSFYSDVKGVKSIDQHMYFDIKTWLVDDILVKADRCSMAHSLEVRTPFLNHTLAEFIIRLPTHKKLRHMTTKYLFKKSQEKRLPHDIIYGKKEGFSIPVGHWISGETKDQIMASPLIKDLLGQKKVEHLITEHGRHHYGYHLFTLLCLSLWEKKWGL